MRDYTLISPKKREIRERRRKEILNGLLTLLVGFDFIITLFGAAHFESTDDPRGIFAAMVAMAVSLVAVIIINIREEKR